jgi:membrane protease subunit (stomatin/prohibitin family)
MKVFTDLKWGTRDPVAFKDSELGLVRLRAFGIFNMQIVQPALFINRMVGTQNIYTAEAVDDYINQVVVSRFNDYMGETIDTILNLPAKYDELSAGMVKHLQGDFARFGLKLTDLFINSITPPPEVEQAIDDRSRMGAIGDMNKLMQMKSAMAMEKAASNEGGAGQGMGMGMGMMMPAMFAQNLATAGQQAAKGGEPAQTVCPACEQSIPADAKFCPHCGHHIVVIHKCTSCGENLTADARFCPHCGHAVDEKPQPKPCPKCGAENLPDAMFCNHCGEKY